MIMDYGINSLGPVNTEIVHDNDHIQRIDLVEEMVQESWESLSIVWTLKNVVVPHASYRIYTCN